ncbi:radical SAM protein [candidate division KSB1 bacterium]|nr:radical SAM protein [candidate division KSB1 bacterium]
MRILLVRPPRLKQAITIGEFMFCEPIGLEIVYAVLKNEHTLEIFDMMIEKTGLISKLQTWQADAVGFTSLCVDVDNVLRLARQAKIFDSNIITLVGGTQTYVEPAAFYDDSIDYIMQYTTQSNLIQLFRYLSKKITVPPIDGLLSRESDYQPTGIAGRNEYIVPDINSTKKYRKHYSYFGFKPAAIIQTSQGCSKHCRFCMRWRIEGAHEHDQDIAVVFDQIQRIREPSIMIFDNDFLHDAQRIHELCELLERHQIHKNFMCYGSVASILQHCETVSRFARNGLAAVLVGYESFNPTELQAYRKHSTVDDNLEAAKFLKSIGVDAWASFILHPDWDHLDFKKFRRYLRKLRPEISSMTPLTPFSNLPLYEEYLDRLIFPKTDYGKWTFGNVSIRPSKMSLRRYYWEILKTNVYINFLMNNTWYLIRKFGFATLFRILEGSVRLTKRYILLMARAEF